MTITTALQLFGRFDIAVFCQFAEDRAHLLNIEMTLQRLLPNEIVLVLRGARALVGMFVMACVIGPAACVVTQWEESHHP
ncbi:hypothetical protein C0V97_07965 [Asaia sp. W19]|uniref:hypothetical protein n=1 Tax=unclassified Asaia TaxID=2685023 RepID=UPI000F8C9FB7|nr:hypothetical protein [Asaia sp. W19]RUT26103.1 hypothetical protein C0V97_07965 [Asaia sp. W19]